METQRRTRQSDEYWRDHVERSKTFAGTLKEYCQANNLSKSNLNRYRRRFGAVNRRKRSAFAKVNLPLTSTETVATSLAGRLPDPRWVAELLMALGGSER